MKRLQRPGGPLAQARAVVNRVLAPLDLELVRINRALIQPWDGDAFFRQVWLEVINNTGAIASSTNMSRTFVLKDLLLACAPQEHVVECGVFQGATAMVLASYLERSGLRPGQRLLLFDSFEGLSEPDPNLDGGFYRKGDCAADLRKVQKSLQRFEFIEFWKGWIPERFEENAERRFSFVHVDVDLYQPVMDCLEFFYPRLVPEGMMVFDDYGHATCPGAKKAVDEYTQHHGTAVVWLPSGQGLVIKSETK